MKEIVKDIERKTFLYKGNPGIIYKGSYIIFLPRENELIELSKEEYNLTKKIASEVPVLNPSRNTFGRKTARLRLITTRDCNLNCKYCFVRGGENKAYLDPNIAKRGLDEVLDGGTEFLNIHFFGGEPTLNKKCITEVVEYSKTKDLKTRYHVTTNGVIDKSFLSYLIENNFIFKISLDGDKSYHDRMRPLISGEGSYKYVQDTIKKISKQNLKFSLRATVTKWNVTFMEKFVREYACLKPSYIHFEPLSLGGRAEASTLEPNWKEFVSNFKKALDVGRDLNVKITTSSIIYLFQPCLIFCSSLQGKNLIITPQGNVTLCLGVQGENDPYSEDFIVGRYSKSSKKFMYDKEKIRKLKTEATRREGNCENCFAKYVCAGGCPLRNKLSRSKRDSYMCKVNKQLIYESIRRVWEESKKRGME